MSLKHILPGMPAEPQSGYDLKKNFDGSARSFWYAELSQIYPQLQKLEDEGFLSSKQEASSKGPPRRVYRRSSKGRRELFKWLRSGPKIDKARISYLGQVSLLPALESPEESLDFFRQLRKEVAAQLSRVEGIDRGLRDCHPSYPDDGTDWELHANITIRHGLKRLTATLEWCDESIERIEARAAAAKRRKRA